MKPKQQNLFKVEIEMKSAVIPTTPDAPFPIDAFPDMMKNFGLSLSDTYRVPPGMFLLMMVATVAAAAGKGWKLRGAVPGHSNFANLFVLLALETGSQKSVVSRIMRPVKEAEEKRLLDWKNNKRPTLEAKRKLAEVQLKKELGKPEPNENTVISLQKTLEKLEERLKRNPSLTLGSVTTAALAKELSYMDHETVMLFSPEGGDLLRVILGIWRDQGMDADLLLSGFTCESYGQSRSGTGTITLSEPCISLLGMIQPCLVKEAFANEEAKHRGLLNRLMSVAFEHPLSCDEGTSVEVCSDAESKWEKTVCRILNGRMENSAEPKIVKCSEDAKNALRDAHNRMIDRLNAAESDVKEWLIRFRELCCRVALCFHIVQSPEAAELSRDTALQAVAVVEWVMNQTLEMLYGTRQETMDSRISEIDELVPISGFITVRDLKRKTRLSESEIRQVCLLSAGEFEIIEFRPPNGGPLSPRVHRPVMANKETSSSD